MFTFISWTNDDKKNRCLTSNACVAVFIDKFFVDLSVCPSTQQNTHTWSDKKLPYLDHCVFHKDERWLPDVIVFPLIIQKVLVVTSCVYREIIHVKFGIFNFLLYSNFIFNPFQVPQMKIEYFIFHIPNEKSFHIILLLETKSRSGSLFFMYTI